MTRPEPGRCNKRDREREQDSSRGPLATRSHGSVFSSAINAAIRAIQRKAHHGRERTARPSMPSSSPGTMRHASTHPTRRPPLAPAPTKESHRAPALPARHTFFSGCSAWRKPADEHTAVTPAAPAARPVRSRTGACHAEQPARCCRKPSGPPDQRVCACEEQPGRSAAARHARVQGGRRRKRREHHRRHHHDPHSENQPSAAQMVPGPASSPPSDRRSTTRQHPPRSSPTRPKRAPAATNACLSSACGDRTPAPVLAATPPIVGGRARLENRAVEPPGGAISSELGHEARFSCKPATASNGTVARFDAQRLGSAARRSSQALGGPLDGLVANSPARDRRSQRWNGGDPDRGGKPGRDRSVCEHRRQRQLQPEPRGRRALRSCLLAHRPR